jgi:hypothetical protein
VLALTDDAELIAAFLACPKIIRGKLRWRSKQHGQYVACTLEVFSPSRPEFTGRLAMTAHLTRLPQKASFSLLLGSARALGLDVNPASTHFDLDSMESVGCTNWQPWPNRNATPDHREFNHLGWFWEFLKRANIKCEARYVSPPFVQGVQTRLGIEP